MEEKKQTTMDKVEEVVVDMAKAALPEVVKAIENVGCDHKDETVLEEIEEVVGSGLKIAAPIAKAVVGIVCPVPGLGAVAEAVLNKAGDAMIEDAHECHDELEAMRKNHDATQVVAQAKADSEKKA